MATACAVCELIEHCGHRARIARLPSGSALLDLDRSERGRALRVDHAHLQSVPALDSVFCSQSFADMRALSRPVGEAVGAVRLNHALLSNVLAHLHWHVIPRFRDDPTSRSPPWPVECAPLRRATDDPALAGAIA